MVTIGRACVVCIVLSLTVIAALPAADEHDAEVAKKYLNIALHWSQYATRGQQHSADEVINTLIDARQMRFYVTFIENHIRRERSKAEAKLAKERQWDYDRNSGGPDVVVGPDMATLRKMQQRKIRDLERTVAAYDAVLDCVDAADDRCVEVREIERKRAEWRRTGDPLPKNPDIPDTNDMRELLQRSLDRHGETLKHYRAEILRLMNATGELTFAHTIFEDRLRDLRTYREAVDAITSELEARRTKCRRVCDEADLSARFVRQSAAEAKWAANECEQKMAAAEALAQTCSTPAEADRIDALVRDAETARDTVVAKIKEAERHNRTLNKWLKLHPRERDVSAIRQRLSAGHAASSDVGGAIIDALVEIKGGFAETDGAHADVDAIVKKLASLDFLDEEAASWERALSDDPATLTVMKRRFADFRSEYATVHRSAVAAVEAAEKAIGDIGAHESLESAYAQESDRIRAAEDAARKVDIPDCTVRAIDLKKLIPDAKNVQGLLGPAAALRKAANACRSGPPPGAGPGPSGPTTPPGGTTSGTGSSPPSTAPAAATGPNPDVHGGLVIVGLPQPATITVGQSVRLQGRDHGGRPYSGVEWVTSNEQALLVGSDGTIVGEQPGEAMVLAKFEGMRAWLDVTVVDPGGTQPAATAPPGPGSGATGSGATGSGATGVPPAGGTGPTATGASTSGGATGSSTTDQAADEGFDFGDGGSGTVEVEPSEDGLLGVSPTADTGAASAPPSQPSSIGLLGQSTAADTGSPPAPEPDEPVDVGEFQTYDGQPYQPFEGFGDTAEPTGPADTEPLPGDVLSFQPLDGSPNTLAPAAPPQPSGPTQADIIRALQQVDCSWLPGGVPAYDGNTGQIGCTCPDGTQLATDRPACIDCISPQQAFMSAVQARNYQLAQQALNAAQGCQWAPGAQTRLRDLVCTQAEMAVLQALQNRGPAAAQNAIRAANAQGCNISPQTNNLVASAAQPPSAGSAPPPRTGPSATEMMQMFTGVAQSLIAMQGGDPGDLPSFGQPGSTGSAPSRPGGGSPPAAQSGGGGRNPAAEEQCARNLCTEECADAIGLLTEGTTERCDRCLKRRMRECAGAGSSGSTGSSGSSSGSGSAFSSGSGAWANPQWTMPTGEGGGRCFAGKSWTRPRRYAIACDGNDGTAHYKLAVGGHPSVIYGPASFTDCQRFLAELTGGQ